MLNKANQMKSQIIALVLFVLVPASSLAQFSEQFESAKPSWQRRDTDCNILNSNWIQRRSNETKAKNRFEKIQFQCGQGTRVLIAHDIPPTFVIPELSPTVKVMGSRQGIQLFARIVLPHTPSPTGKGPMTTLLPGELCSSTGQWRTLTFQSKNTDLQQQLQEEIWLLRRKFGSDVTERDAYVDKIVLNIYTGPGESTVQIDDLIVDGIVSAKSLADQVKQTGHIHSGIAQNKTNDDPNVVATSFIQDSDKQPSLVKRDGTVLLVKDKPFMPRVIQHNGESFEYLKSVGFNTIELKTVATPQQLRKAQTLDLWLVCPPPNSVGLNPIDFQYDRVLAWSVGKELTGRQIELVQQRVQEIRESDQRQGRPIIGHVESHWTQISQLLDIVGVGKRPIGTSFFASRYSEWINQRVMTTGNGKPIWADVQTELSESLHKQLLSLARQIPPVPIDPQQLKFLAYESITGGARGLRFTSRSRLDAPDPETRLRAQTIEWVNAELQQIEPWVAGGALMGQVSTSDPKLEINAINTPRSRLLLIQRPTDHEQYLAGDVPIKPVSFVDSNATMANRAYQLTEAGLNPLPNTKDHAGARIQLENCPALTAIVLTEDPLVINRLNQSYQRIGQKTFVQMRRDLSQQWIAIMQLINNQLVRIERSPSSVTSILSNAANAFQTAETLIGNRSEQLAIGHLNRVDERLALARREIVTEPLGAFQSKTSSPFVSHCSLVPLHWGMANRLAGKEWNPNGLPGGDFEDLGHMQANGWANQRLEDPSLQTKVELSKEATVDGKFGLKMSVSSNQANLPLVEAPVLWIRSPKIPVKSGQLVRIHGWVRIPTVIRGSHDGLTITDSMGSTEMSERITITQGWQEFTLYRGVNSSSDLDVTFSLTGIGEVYLDEVTIRTIDLPPQSPRQAKR
jgi:hypothetical protein